MSGDRGSRLSELDGLRGWAALSVVFYHIFWESFGVRFPELRAWAVALPVNGTLAVYIFFVVSGAALSAPFFRRFDRKVVLLSVVKRYPRLTFPILFAALALLAASNLGLIWGSEAAAMLGRQDWLGLNSQSPITLLSVAQFSLIDVYRKDGGMLPFLWTMPVEMIGSFLLFLYLSLYDMAARPIRLLVIITAATFVIYPYACCFFAGCLISALRGRGWLAIICNRWLVAVVALLCGLSLGAAVNKTDVPFPEQV